MSSPLQPDDRFEAGTIQEARELLNAELPDQRFVDDQYLDWLYNKNPYGQAITGFRRNDQGVLDGHYALIPQRYSTVDGPIPFMFSLNAVSRSGAQKKGHFVSLTKELFGRARDAGFVGAIGVTNDNSTRAVKRTDFRYLGPMPVIVRPAVGRLRSTWSHHRVDAELLDGDFLERMLVDAPLEAQRGMRNLWTPEYLRWRLASPHNRGYVIHISDDLFVVSNQHRVGPVPVAVILKVLLRRPTAKPQAMLDGHDAMLAAARFHNAPASLYGGFNIDVQVEGWHPPRSRLPSPMNLNYVPFTGAIPVTTFDVETYEFLDCDAY